MAKFYIILPILFVLMRCPSYAQENPQDGHFTGSVSAGPNYYYNNIKTFGEYVRPVNFSVFGRIMWNSRYLVSLGIETGYNKFYRVDGFEQDAIKASLAAVPLHLVIGMRITKSFYANFSFGPALLLNTASSSTLENTINNKVWSLADGSLCFGYRKRLGRDFTLGAEFKFNFSTRASDLNWALPVVLSYDF